jgi:hypothetical protein
MRGATYIARADAFASAAESLFEAMIWLEMAMIVSGWSGSPTW